jgi:UDP-N-acetylmuramate dehydrogenase
MPIATGMEGIVREQEPLAPLTWFQLGGPAALYAEPTSIEELHEVVARCCHENMHVRILGGGSNILVRDEGVSGMVISLDAPCFNDVRLDGRRVIAGGAAKLAHVISAAVRHGLGGLEPLVGIPGTIGGALHGNAGGRGGDIGQWACAATVMTRTGEIVEQKRDDLVFAYRQSSLDELAILSAEFELEEDDPEQLTKQLQKLWIVKKANQPMSHERTGSIFRNPRGMSAGMLIEQAGMKGTTLGQVEVSQRHSNFIVAHEGATSQDVLKLIDLVRSRVAERLGVELETDIEIW